MRERNGEKTIRIIKKLKILILLLIPFLIFPIRTYSLTYPKVIEEALKHLNEPYYYSATGPRAFDCSGLVWYCYNNTENVILKRTAKEQGYDTTYTQIINIQDLLPGDTLYFNTNKNDEDMCDHAGLYIGNGLFIHCSSGKGKVIISSLCAGYYNKCFSWGRRIKEVIK